MHHRKLTWLFLTRAKERCYHKEFYSIHESFLLNCNFIEGKDFVLFVLVFSVLA